jgi:hypothetical protein
MNLIAMGQPEAALKEAELESPDSGRQYALTCAYAALGRKADSDAALAKLAHDSPDRPYEIAMSHACRKEISSAFDWLFRAYTSHDVELAYIKSDEAANPLLKGDPRWADVLRKMKLPE